jgi:hypothetical protein
MSFRYRQRRMLRRLGNETVRADPRLAEMLAQFSRLAAGQPMPAQERLRTPLGLARAAVRGAGLVLAAAFGAVLRGLRLAMTACAIADRWLAARLPDAAPGWTAAGVWAGIQPDRPRLPGR